jgi:quercetin dioxygenase-like cupin family protein
MERWHLPSVDATGATEPRVLFSRSEARAVVLDLTAGQELGEHSVRETAIVQVVTGTVELETGERSVSCEAGTLVLFEPGERHAVSALTDSRLLLLLAPWPAEDHYLDDENARPDRIPEAIRAPAIDDV